jgi:hypothetical protein
MSGISSVMRAAIVRRAGNCCEYCQLSQAGQEATFHIDHVLPRAEGGQTIEDNLALACVSCSLHKAAKLTATDPDTRETAALFNPRSQNWADHFRWERERMAALTATGRATIAALQLNRPLILSIREEETFRGRHPAP